MRLITIALNTVRYILRFKFAAVFILFMMVILIWVPFTLKSDGTQQGKIQITLAFTLSVINIVLSLLTLFLSTSIFCSDIKSRIIFTVDTKPVRRWEIMGGKWLGILIINIGLLLCFGGAVYGTVMYLGRPIEGKEKEFSALKREVLTSRIENRPLTVKGKKKEPFVVAPMHEKEWIFENVRAHLPDETITVKFKYYTPGNAEESVEGIWIVGSKENGFYRHSASLPSKAFHEFEVPGVVVSPEGRLIVKFVNISNRGISATFPANDVVILHCIGGFGINYFRAFVLIFLRLAFIAAVGITASTFLTFPVATLLSIFVLVMSLSIPFVNALLGRSIHHEQRISVGESSIRAVMSGKLVSLCLKSVPDLRAYDPVPKMVSGIYIGWNLVIRGFLGIVLLRCGIIGLLGFIIFSKRELADMGYL